MRDIIKVYQNSVIKQAYKRKTGKQWLLLTLNKLFVYDAGQGIDIAQWDGVELELPSNGKYKNATDVAYFKGKYYVVTRGTTSDTCSSLFVTEDLENWEIIDDFFTGEGAGYDKNICASNDTLVITYKQSVYFTHDGINWTKNDDIATVYFTSDSLTTFPNKEYYRNALFYSSVYNKFFQCGNYHAAVITINGENLNIEYNTLSDCGPNILYNVRPAGNTIMIGHNSKDYDLAYSSEGFITWGSYSSSAKRADQARSFFDVKKLSAKLGQDIDFIALGRYSTYTDASYDYTIPQLFYGKEGDRMSSTNGGFSSNDKVANAYCQGMADWDDDDTVLWCQTYSVLRCNSMSDIIKNKLLTNYLSTKGAGSNNGWTSIRCVEVD